MTNTVLVTGGAGFIGSNFIHMLCELREGWRIVNFDALTYAGNLENLREVEEREGYHFVRGDVANEADVTRALDVCGDGPLYVVHMAAESHVDRSILSSMPFIQANVVGTQVLLDACRARGVERFVHVSTDEVYGSLGEEGFFTEETPLAPNSPYSASKAASDLLVRAAFHTHGFPACITRCSNNYGPYQFPEKLIPLMIVNILHGKPLPIYGDGMQIRDWLYVDDHCRAIDLVLEKGRPGEVYNIGGANERPNIDIVNELCAMLEARFQASEDLRTQFPDSPGSKGGESNASLITYVTDRPGHDRRYAIDYSKAHSELGYEPVETFQTGFARTIDWYLAEVAWWQAVTDGSYRDWIETNYSSR